jgi:hypothetical protein
MPILLAVVVAGASVQTPALDGTRLRAGTMCYAITRDGAAIGATLQRVRPVVHAGRRAWDIIIHQRVAQMGFDLRDHFLVDRRTMRPIRLESARGTDRAARGWQRITVNYGANRIRGTRETAAAVTPIDEPLAQPVWDGNLWGLAFAALPLRKGGRYTIPFWQYDKGFGRFTVDVVGSERVNGSDVWVVEAGDDPARRTRYLIGKRDHRELGYGAGNSGQRAGGDCSGLD